MTSITPTDLPPQGHDLPHAGADARSDPLPLAGLLALAMAGFITMLTEVMPAGLLPRISASLAVSESMAGQLITVYALGSLLTAIPLITATQGMRRRQLLLLAIGGFAVTNTVTAMSGYFWLTLAARFFAGVSAGLVWALLASYAARMVSSHLAGRAIAISGIGAPLAFSVGVPAGTFLGGLVGWRLAFGIMSGLTVLLIGLVLAKLPDFPGQPEGRRQSLRAVVRIPGIRSILFVIFAFVVAHNILYTYIAPFLAPLGLLDRVDGILLVFGVGGLAGLWIAGVLIDRWLREVVLVSIVAFIASVLALAFWSHSSAVVYGAVALWGVVFGGAPALFQTASAKAAGESADVAQAMIVTVWNLAIAAGGIAGGVLLDSLGVVSFPWAMVVALAPTLWVAWAARRHGFPAVPRAGKTTLRDRRV